jgi:demethylmenaquinone methyltransferase/2-methoxy-6-polyprenyl-1,4-benzoquinol methylase
MGLLGLFRTLKAAHARDIASAIAGVKPGDRVLVAGPDNVKLAAEIAIRAGLNGHVVALAPNRDTALARAVRIKEEGGLAEALGAPLNMLPLDSGTFDVAVAEETLLALTDADRRGAIAELFRVLRPGGRLLWVDRHPRGGLFRAAPDSRGVAPSSDRERALIDAGFRAVRTLAEAEGRAYVEGIKAAS